MGQLVRKIDGDGVALVGERTNTNATTNASLTPGDFWLSSEELAKLSGCGLRTAQRGLNTKRFMKTDIVVREKKSNVGRGGMSLCVHVDCLPSDLKDAWYLQHGIDLHAKREGGVTQAIEIAPELMGTDDTWGRKNVTANFKLAIIRPILNTPERSKARVAVINSIDGTMLEWPDGQRKVITRATLYNWIKAYNGSGLHGLMRKKRSDTKARRTLVTRGWDGFFEGRIGSNDHAQVADDLTTYIRSLWAAGEPGWRSICEKATTKLIELSDALGVDAFECIGQGRLGDPASTMTRFGVCNVNRRRAENERSYRLIAVKDKDNAVYQDKHASSIRRDYSMLMPREIVVGDVHPVDIMMRRADGSMVFPKAISWLDPATNEIHMTFVMCEKGEGIRREHVAQSFEAMVDEWGLPKLLYLDNGSEYKWQEMIAGFTMLSKLAGSMSVFDLGADNEVSARVNDCREAVVRSLAYNAKGKPKIEGAFGNIEQVFFATIQGWTAGDRMNKKTHAKGRDPVSFSGTPSDFLATAGTQLEWYHKRPQHGRLKGRSPNETLGRYIDEGWGKVVLSRPEVLALAFAVEEVRTVDRGRVQYTPRNGAGTIFFYHDTLLGYGGRKITVKVPAYNPEFVFCFDGPDLICLATPEQTFHPLDRAGAVEGGHRNKALRRHIAEKRKHCALLSLVDETERHIAHLPDAPEAPIAATVDAGIIERMAAMEAAAREALLERMDNKPKNNKPVDQWGVSEDAVLGDVTFLEEEHE